jgi:hypothetical protein
MRRMLKDIESRADAKAREFERNCAEANALGRRRARETEELRIEIREVERALQRAGDKEYG